MRDTLDEAKEYCRGFGSPEEIAKYPFAAMVLRLANEVQRLRPTNWERQSIEWCIFNLKIPGEMALAMRELLERTKNEQSQNV